ncbi:MAG: hypothetical protein M3Y41_09530 [Pseudomonadota bacterium]|nr:hypothetical protein [Pseudomonadota bacterium]
MQQTLDSSIRDVDGILDTFGAPLHIADRGQVACCGSSGKEVDFPMPVADWFDIIGPERYARKGRCSEQTTNK